MKNQSINIMVATAIALFPALASAQTWVEQAVLKKAMASTELDQHIAHTLKFTSATIPYKVTPSKYAPTLYRTKLEFENRWDSGFSKMGSRKLILLTSGMTQIFNDNISSFELWLTDTFANSDARRNDILPDALRDSDPLLVKLRPAAVVFTEKYLRSNAKGSIQLIPSQTLVIEQGYSQGKAYFYYQLELVGRSIELGKPVFKRYYFYAIVLNGPELLKKEFDLNPNGVLLHYITVFPNDPKYIQTFDPLPTSNSRRSL